MQKKTGFSAIGKIEQMTTIRAIRNGLINITPVLIVGAFALILTTFPVQAYQDFITSFAGGLIPLFLDLIYKATFGVLSVYMTFSISRSYMKLQNEPEIVNGGAIIASLLSFFILTGAYLPDFGTEKMGPKAMFLAVITGLGASALYVSLNRFLRRRRRYLFSAGASREFNRMLSTLLPIIIVAIFFALINIIVMRVFDVDSFHALLIRIFNDIFALVKNGFLKGLLFVFLSSLLWFFGIHGSDTLEGVMQTYFAPGLAANQAAAAAGAAPSTVLTKEFFDCFVLMGGCGSAICLLIAILLFSRNRARRGLGLAAAFPMIFNINELMVFGLPIIFNPTMLIPFLAVPMVCYSTAYLAISTGLVPMITSEVAWTTPILLGGLRATGSVAGLLLQLVNVTLGVLIYMPFIRLMDRQSIARAKHNYEDFMRFFRKNETDPNPVRLIDLSNVYGDFAKDLCTDITYNMNRHIDLAYQPQYNYNGECIGVEALLRWRHPIHGLLYPPLVIKLAEERGFLPDLEETIMKRALADRPELQNHFGPDVKLSINITGTTVVTPRFLQFCRELNEKDPVAGKNICIEVTEQAALSFSDENVSILRELRDMGFLLAIDDFSMGQTSINYLKDNLFDIIKLDGSLVRGMYSHQNSAEIIASIIKLASSLKLVVLAEFVENEEERDSLHEMGCDNYQGYLYSPALFLSELDKQ